MIKSSPVHPQRSTETQWEMVKAKHHPTPAPPSPIPGAISPSQAHLDMPGGAQGAPGQVEPQSKDSEEGTPLSRAVLGEPQPQCPDMTPTTMGQEEQLQIHFWTGGVAAWGVGHVMGCWERSPWTVGHLGKKQEVGMGIDLDDLGRNNCGRREA